MAASDNKSATSKKAEVKSTQTVNKDLETEMPLSEKDEVKRAERNTAAPAKKST
ncbi:hypothetical protein [Mucilaginibacter phyllosphaerae]|uniref:Alkyl sulfatase BDS1-like metallo-beta-lactamase superfamily hydrolase n=1 Tax=Mucilaginibacter phyllosphaerae TaxID=1812349 RepID=A0ABR6I732_9SPHI|nr:hypothetical protein [Mucilaginibacter phyllosphaerae]MBB3968836.1 alkyl sulfatase BDS1-like metallo-beta-lactamase superfamily hydrolase [Mucilaginibacter phyllosphaerae]GGH13610.1 hypothetical protein GCM10007352_21150 [Mucilaginibacter phyllosphaerae]